MNNPFDYTPDAACEEAFHRLVDRLEALKRSARPADRNFCRELDNGKMLGVLIALDAEGRRHTLYAFSGQLGEEGFCFPGFTGPVFDYLQPEGYFKTMEADISRQNKEIAGFERGTLADAEADCLNAKEVLQRELDAYREKCRKSKEERDSKREAGALNEAELAAMIRQSQFEKAELRRLKRRLATELEPYESRCLEAERWLKTMKERRRADSEALQNWLFTNFTLLNAKGERRSLSDIFAETPLKVPPSGAGECCAPKLLQAAYLRGLKPVAMAEYWYGRPKDGELRRHGEHYPACRGKCLPVLSWMLQGLEVEPPLSTEYGHSGVCTPEVIFENEWFCVIDKPGGMLSVPGKGAALSVQQWLMERYGPEKEVKVAHRLDQDTSGLLVATFGTLAFKLMQSLFATRKVRKEYVADLEGDYRISGLPREGRIDLPLSPDWLDRPRQRVDFETGKEAETDYEFVGVEHGRSRVIFRPHTGRTHQLRVHSASEHGLGMPIAGDRLYGKRSLNDSGINRERLHLHARKIEFTFPVDGRMYSFESLLPF